MGTKGAVHVGTMTEPCLETEQGNDRSVLWNIHDNQVRTSARGVTTSALADIVWLPMKVGGLSGRTKPDERHVGVEMQ